MDINIYRNLCLDSNIAITQHAQKRFLERNILLDDIKTVIMTGTIIKEYPDDQPFPSCLVLEKSVNGQPVHIVISTDSEFIYVITAYHPDPQLWNNTFTQKRKE